MQNSECRIQGEESAVQAGSEALRSAGSAAGNIRRLSDLSRILIFVAGMVLSEKCAAKTRRREERREEEDSCIFRGFAPSRRIGFLLGMVVAVARSFGADVPTTQPIANFVRFEEDGHGGGKMQAAMGRYVNEDGVQVDLLSTMHIGDQAFFRDLSKRFPKYDSVLYELVAPRGVPPTEEGVNDQQMKIARDCELENQGPHMSYDRKNFVHADLTLEEIQKLEVARHGTFKGALGEGPGIKAARDEHDTAGQKDIYADIQAAKLAGPVEKVRLMRRAYSRLLAVTAEPGPGLTYPPGMEVLVGARDDEVIRVLSRQMADGDKNLAIFYGAAHMVDLEHRLLEMGFKRQSISWQTAWTVAPDGTLTTQPAHALRR